MSVHARRQITPYILARRLATFNTEVVCEQILCLLLSSVRTPSSASSSTDGVETEMLAADLVLPPTGTQPGHSSGSKPTEVYYFYQAADGQLVYLHSINTRLVNSVCRVVFCCCVAR